MATDQAFIKNALGALGNDELVVAHTLHTLGIKGRPSAPASCPVARYIKAQGTDVRKASTGTTETLIYLEKSPTFWRYDFLVAIPYPVQAFIEMFDKGYFPDLEEK